jgi:glycosyltransferase involved in cell wall biosynthesis
VPPIERKRALKRVWDALVDGHVPKQADAVIATSRAEARDLLAFGVDGARIRRIPNALWMEEFEALPTRAEARARLGLEDGPVVAYLGQVTPRKRVDRLAEAFEGGALHPARLVIAGPARGAALPPGVRHLGVLEGRARLELLVAADVLAYPSEREVFGLVPMEGLLCGAPVVVGDDCGCAELVHEAGAGVVVDGSVASIRAALAGLLADPARARELAARGRTFVERHLAPRRVAEAHLALYREMLEGAAA